MNEKSPHTHAEGGISESISSDQAITLLSLGIQGPERPVDSLIHRLRQRDGQQWIQRELCATPLGSTDLVQSLLDGSASLSELSQIKDQAKTQIVDAATIDTALASLAIYCLAVASGLAHHRQLISDRTRETWDMLLLDLAEVAPQAWRPLLLEAAAS